MQFSVGIATYRRSRHLEEALDSLLEQTRLPDEVHLVDDGDGEAVRDVVRSYRSDFEDRGVSLHYRQRKNENGPASARNEIIEAATGDVICFLDDDVRCKPGWLESIAETYRTFPEVAAVGGPAIVVNGDLCPVLDLIYTETDPNPITKYGEVGSYAGRWLPPRPVETDSLIGANLSIRTDVVRDMGGFDTAYDEGTGAFEDMDLMARLWHRDETVLYHPEAFVYHFQPEDGGTRAVPDEQFSYWVGRNVIRLRWKNFRSNFVLGMLRFLVYNRYYPPSIRKQVVGGVLNRNPSNLWFLKGVFDGLRHETR